MENYLQVNGKYYAIDMDKVMDFITSDTSSLVQAINQTYGIPTNQNGNQVCDITLMQKDVTETKENIGNVVSGYKYNIITNMMGLVLSPMSSEYGDTVAIINDIEGYGVGQRIAFNTLVGMGIIYEIETDD